MVQSRPVSTRFTAFFWQVRDIATVTGDVCALTDNPWGIGGAKSTHEAGYARLDTGSFR